MKSIITNNFNYLTTYEPTYWPTDTNTIPDLLNFFITKNISPRYVQINSSAELSSDHSSVIATVCLAIIENPPNGFIHNQLTIWQLFREVFNHSTFASISLKTKEDIETATEYLNTSIINAIRSTTPTKTSISKHEYPHYILKKITVKRRLRRVWQTRRIPDDKRKLNNATRKLTKIIKKYKNDCFQKYLGNLSPIFVRAAELHERVKRCSSESASIGENKVTNDNVHRQMVENATANSTNKNNNQR